MSDDYRQVTDGEWVRHTLKGHYDQCCNCGLVHVLDFDVVDRSTGEKIPNAAVYIRARRDRTETKAVRRKLKRKEKA